MPSLAIDATDCFQRGGHWREISAHPPDIETLGTRSRPPAGGLTTCQVKRAPAWGPPGSEWKTLSTWIARLQDLTSGRCNPRRLVVCKQDKSFVCRTAATGVSETFAFSLKGKNAERNYLPAFSHPVRLGSVSRDRVFTTSKILVELLPIDICGPVLVQQSVGDVEVLPANLAAIPNVGFEH